MKKNNKKTIDLSTNSHKNLANFKRREFLKDSVKIAGFSALAASVLSAKSLQKTTDLAQNHAQIAVNNKLAKTDPEFMKNHANFAFDEVFSQSKNIDLQMRLKLILGALIAVQGRAEFGDMLITALKNGVNPIEIKEIIYHTTPYIGIGKSRDFLELCNEIFKDYGIKLPLKDQGTTTQSNREQKGLEIQRKFFGEYIDKGNASAPDDEKHIRRFLSANCFGDYYTRNGLELNFRELLTFVILASLGGADAQVKAHVRGNLNIGHSREFLIEVITALVPYIGYPRTLNALAALDEVSLNKDKK